MSELVLMNPAERGKAVMLTYAERVALDIRTTRPSDVPWAEVQLLNRERRRERQKAKARANAAARQAKPTGLTARERDLLNVIPENGKPVAASWLCSQAAAMPSFRDRNGKKLGADAIRQAVHRALDALAKSNRIADELVEGMRGLQVRLVTRV